MESETSVEQSPPAQAVIMQMVMGVWVATLMADFILW
jgi:hypothetical protein